ncbi:unnamed protein product [Cylindrotheca closterium]|uniref:Phytanoyl-CoA dioxygenase n=1 Tax=Cylindrotheca closterium TaxID=2856 RepID=A0AAD2G409_9STRA|nr:unnamed protein product [Cylindrotheca closterium]
MDFYSYKEIPLEEDDARYSQSFAVDEATSETVQDFFEAFGFVVFRDVISSDECSQTIDSMWSHLEKITPSLERENGATWDLGFSSFGSPKDNSSEVVFEPFMLRLRQHPLVVQCFASILKSTEIICSHDRWLMHRPTKVRNGVFRSDWATKPNVHLDLNPPEFVDNMYYSEIMHRLDRLDYASRKNRAFLSENNDVHQLFGRVVQGILNLDDLPCDENGGGTLLIPGSHRCFDKWAKSISRDKLGCSSYRFGPEMIAVAQRVTMRAGSLVIWDQRLIHGSTTNKSSRMRYGIPIRFFSAGQMSSKRAQDRSETLRRILKHNKFDNDLTAIGKKVFFGEECDSSTS